MLLAAAVIAGSASAFAPPASARASTQLFEDAAVEAEAAPAEPAFCLGYVGGEGPEPIPFAISQTSVNWDPLDFAGVSRDTCVEIETLQSLFRGMYFIGIDGRKKSNTFGAV